jgi:hypothetical protein
MRTALALLLLLAAAVVGLRTTQAPPLPAETPPGAFEVERALQPQLAKFGVVLHCDPASFQSRPRRCIFALAGTYRVISRRGHRLSSSCPAEIRRVGIDAFPVVKTKAWTGPLLRQFAFSGDRSASNRDKSWLGETCGQPATIGKSALAC